MSKALVTVRRRLRKKDPRIKVDGTERGIPHYKIPDEEERAEVVREQGGQKSIVWVTCQASIATQSTTCKNHS